MPTFPIDIQYYNDQEKQKIQSNFPDDFAKIEGRLGTFNLSFEDFQAYSLFRHQCSHVGYSTFREFLQSAERCWGTNELYLEQKKLSKNLVCKYPGDVEAKDVSESIGVGGGLSVFGHLYGLHQADWKRIGIQPFKDLDFTRTSSVGSRTLIVELKGSIVDNNDYKTN